MESVLKGENFSKMAMKEDWFTVFYADSALTNLKRFSNNMYNLFGFAKISTISLDNYVIIQCQTFTFLEDLRSDLIL